jgi:Zn-dependent protease
MRTLLAVRIPAEVRLKPTKLKQPPDIMADLFAQTDQLLSDLGFSQGYWANVHTNPPLPGFSASLIRLYHHKKKPVIARVSPPHSIYLTDRCEVTFISISKRKTFLVTSNRVSEFFPRPPEDRVILLNNQFDSVAAQFRAHVQEKARRGFTWLDYSKERGEVSWTFRLANRYEAKRIEWLDDNQYVKRLADGSSLPRIGIVLNFIRRHVTGRGRNRMLERSAIPSNRAAYLLRNWQRASSLPPPISIQLGFFLGSTLAFILLTGLIWDWAIALLLIGVISFHEAGHWLAMRSLGYRDFQILMLPLVGGVTLVQKTGYKTAHRILVSLMGPLPGIILGSIILWFNGMDAGLVTKLGITLLVVNYLTLLPFMPLDGGQLLKALVPTRRYGVLIALQWLGSVPIILLGLLSQSLFLVAMVLLPFFSGLALMKRRRIIDTMRIVMDVLGKSTLNDPIVYLIRAVDITDKTYRPLKKKAREITEIIAILRMKPVAPRVARLFLAVYLVTFLLPPVVVYATWPGIENIRILFSSDSKADNEAIAQSSQDRIMTLSMSQLVKELADWHKKIYEPNKAQGEQVVIRPAATSKSISLAEMRLGTSFNNEHRQFLETSNGFINQMSYPDRKDYLIFPVEEVDRFAQMLPEMVNRFRSENSSKASHLVQIQETSDAIEAKSESLNLNQLAPMLVIGNPHVGNYLLLDLGTQSDTPALLYEVYETPGGLEGRRFKSLRHYLAYHLSMLQYTGVDPS